MSLGRILIVDDEPAILDIVETYLQVAGYLVIKANSATQGIALAKEVVPDLILMDVMLPDMNGADAVKKIRADLFIAHIPVIFLTGMITRSEETKQHLSIQVDGHAYHAVAKPIDKQDLLGQIQRILN
jgi:CheY-like chemotaxis protein